MTEFEEIRPYYDHEINAVLRELAIDPQFIKIVSTLYTQPGATEQILQMMTKVDTIDQFQKDIVVPLLKKIMHSTTDGISYSAMEQFHPEESYLFISNHRDIILDSAFFNVIMHEHGFKKTEIAIGDNLLIFDWIKKLVRINRSFMVKRNLSLREQLKASQTLSAYIRYAITEKEESIWLAQREGRTKDGNDQTQAALLKMLNMSNKSSMTDGFKALNIVPMAISYEIEPCGISKVGELLKRKYDPDFTKTQQDDLHSMANGVMQPKGRIHFAFGNPLNIKIEELTANKKNNEVIQAIVEYIDKRIYANYKLWPNNYIAADLLNKNNLHKKHYTEEERLKFIEQLEKETTSLQYKKDEAVDMYIRMYANPLFNFEKHFVNE